VETPRGASGVGLPLRATGNPFHEEANYFRFFCEILCFLFLALFGDYLENPIILCGQAVPYASQHSPRRKKKVEGLLKDIPGPYAGQKKLPIVDGFWGRWLAISYAQPI